MKQYMERLFPLNRSLTGEPNRETLRILRKVVPLTMIEYPSGMKLYDEWVVPDEWNCERAWVTVHVDGFFEGDVNFDDCNLQLIGYSIPFDDELKLDQLESHLHISERQPAAIPYRTSYYDRDWGFCITAKQYDELFAGKHNIYTVDIKTTLEPGSMTVGEYLIPGCYKQEYLVSTYICHPSMANDNTSGMVLTAFLARELAKRELNYSWRFVWCPETIGAIAYLFNNEAVMKRIDCGLVVTCVAGPNQIGYKQSFDKGHRLNGIIDRVLHKRNLDFVTYPFDCDGSDERQYSSQGFRINCPSIHSDRYYEYKEYHTSLDNLDFISYERLAAMLDIHVEVALEMDRDLLYTNLQPFGEPRLGPRGLYEDSNTEAVLALLQMADGKTPLSVISKKSGIGFGRLHEAAVRMVELELLEEDCVKNDTSN